MSRKRKINAAQAIADQALKLLAKGNRCPTTKELLRCLNGQRQLGPEKTRRLLAQVRRRLERVYNLSVCCISSAMYEPERGANRKIIRKRFLERLPQSQEDALKCLPGGIGRRIAGLYFPGKNDRIFEEYTLRYVRQGMAETRLNVGRIEVGLSQQTLPKHSTAKRLGDSWQEYLGDILSPPIEKAIEKAFLRIESK